MKQLSRYLLLLFLPFLAIAQPSNDTCGNSTTITVPVGSSTLYAADLTTATESIDGSCETPASTNHDAWYTFVMPEDGNSGD